MNQKWQIMSNQFIVATRNNYKKAYKLSREHDSRLKKRMDDNPGDPDSVTTYDRYHLLHLALETAYTTWKSKGGMQKGDTLNIDQLLAMLPGKANKFDLKIQAVHDKGSPRYMQLFPQSHKPFYMGTQESMIAAVETLSISIGDEVALAAVKLLVDAALAELMDAKDVQTGKMVVGD